jgi:protein Mpv17
MELISKFFQKHLLVTNIALSVTLSGVGDILQQKYENRNRPITLKSTISQSNIMPNKAMSSLSTNRTIVQSIAFGGVAGVLCHFWYNHLDKMYSAGHRQIKVVAKKILCDQIIFSPICIVACLIAACVLNGRDKEKMYEEVYHKGQELYLAEWLLWPPAQFINFYFLPTRYRVLYDNIVSLFYDVYTSYVQNKPCC